MNCPGPDQTLLFLRDLGGWYLGWCRGICSWLGSPFAEQLTFESLYGDYGREAQIADLRRVFRFCGIKAPEPDWDAVIRKVVGFNSQTWSGARTDRALYWDSRVEQVFAELGGYDVNRRPESITHAGYEPALRRLLDLYDVRADLQNVFPEALHWDFRRLLDWARRVSQGRCVDSGFSLLEPFAEWYEQNSVDLADSARPAPEWELLTATSGISSAPLPHTLQQMRDPRCVSGNDHLMMLAFLVSEFGLRQIVELGTREGHATVALLEAAKSNGGRVMSISADACRSARERIESLGLEGRWTFKQGNGLDLDEGEMPHPIDLLFIDTAFLYSRTLAELRKFAGHVRAGGWIALHNSASFPASRAVLEAVQSFVLRPRFYPFINQGGLILLRIGG
jgi:predicted O-methyltransferase YrrM